MTATINVNLRPCDCSHRRWLATTCVSDCASTPILLPCPVPTSFICVVRLGECRCPTGALLAQRVPGVADCNPRLSALHHLHGCPARPVRVSCSIRSGPPGQEWAGSEVGGYVKVHGGHAVEMAIDILERCMAAARALWKIVVALVAGDTEIVAHTHEQRALLARLYPQRDAVFSALADMARAECAAWSAQNAAAIAFKFVHTPATFHRTLPADRPSAHYLAAYAEHLIEQVGVL
jgi:hypothetical protein